MYLNIGQAAKYLHLHPDTLRRWEKSGKIKSIKVGKRKDRRFELSELEKLLPGQHKRIEIDAAKIRALCKSHFPEVVSFLSNLVKTKSVNGVNPEKDIANRIYEEALKLDLPALLLWKDQERPNIFVGQSLGDNKQMVFAAHTDTVPAGNENKWTYPPFGGEIHAGKLFGRGAADCKAGITTSIYALKILHELGYGHIAKFIGGSDEEAGAQSDIGILYALQKGLKGSSAIYTYTGFRAISLGNRGLLRFRIISHGEQVHTGLSKWARKLRGKNAIEGLFRFAYELEKINLSKGHRDFPKYTSTQTITMINGGTAESMVPDRAEMLLDVRLLPSFKSEDYILRIQKIKQAMERKYQFQYEIILKNNGPSMVLSKRTPIIQILKKLTKEVIGVAPVLKGRGPFNESGFLTNAGIPTVGGFGVTGENAHSVDEHVVLKTIPKIMEIYVRTAIEMWNRNLRPKTEIF